MQIITTPRLTVGGLFSGIGGLELGLEQAGMAPAKWHVEINPYCQRVLAKHWPDSKLYGDIRHVGKHNLEPVDVICGGFPCQDISWAGKRAGITGEESGLWTEYLRIVREMRPRFVVIENVARLVRAGLRAVLESLASVGYDAEWQVIPAWLSGSPQVRERVFIVAYPMQPWETRRWSSRIRWGRGCQGQTGQDGWSGHAEENVQLWAEPGVGRVADGVPGGVDRINALGNAVVPAVAKMVGEAILRSMEDTRANHND